MKITFIEPSGAGGIGHYTYGLARALGMKGIKCDILTSKRWTKRDLPASVQIKPIFNGRKTNPFALLRHCLSIRQTSDIVHWQSTTHPRLLCRLMQIFPHKNIPWVFTVHNVLPHESDSNSIDIYHWIYHRMEGLIYHTRFSQSEFARLFPDCKAEKTIIPLGEYGFLADSESKSTYDVSNQTILFFGNIRPYKGLDTLIQAFAIVKEAIPAARLQIVGQALEPFAPYDDLIQQFRLQSYVDKRIEYISDDEISDVFSKAAVVALPYHHIDQSAVLLLAMASGKAVVATNVGGIPEVIRDGETGVLIPPNDPRSLSAALIDLLQQPDKAKRIGQAARMDVLKNYSWDTIAEKTISFYDALLSQ